MHGEAVAVQDVSSNIVSMYYCIVKNTLEWYSYTIEVSIAEAVKHVKGGGLWNFSTN